jgi:hypothetical protein
MPMGRWLSKMIQSVTENDIIREDRVRIRSILSRIHTHVYRIVYGCKQRAKSVDNLYTSVRIKMSIGRHTREYYSKLLKLGLKNSMGNASVATLAKACLGRSK